MQQQQPLPSQPKMRQRRSVSDIAHHIAHPHREPLQTLDLQAMVRLSGKSVLYLPPDFVPGALVLPTCIRATAQHLAQHTTASGIFRVPGSVRLVNALFDYYCYMEKQGVSVSNTVHCASLPMHIQASVHDVASTFKRLLSVLPGGILGTLSLFDAFVAIHSLLSGEPEFPRTKQTKVRARLIALAIGTVQSQFRRELICAVFGLLSLIGRTAEVAPREDDTSRPLPTADLMGYSALGIVFGPLLVGELLEQYTMNLASPHSGLLLFPLSSPKKLQKGQRGRRKSVVEDTAQKEVKTVDKILVANGITEMLIANWRDIVRQMKSLGTHHRKGDSTLMASGGSLRPSMSESFTATEARDREKSRRESAVHVDRDGSPELDDTPTRPLQRPRSKKSAGSNKLRPRPSGTVLSPTVEEGSSEDMSPHQRNRSRNDPDRSDSLALARHKDASKSMITDTPTRPAARRSTREETAGDEERLIEMPQLAQFGRQSARESLHEHEVSWEDVPPRTSSKQRGYFDTSAISQSIQADDVQPQNVESFQDYAREQDPVQKSTLRHLSSAPRPRDSLISEGSQVSYSSAKRATEVDFSPAKKAIDSQEFDSMQALPREPPVTPSMENQRPSSRRETHSSYQSRASQADNDVFSASHPSGTPNGRPSPQTSQPARNSSIDTTPTHFYASMKIPATLAGENEEKESRRTSTVKVSPTHTAAEVSTRKTSASVASRPPAAGGEPQEPPKGSLTADRLSRFEQLGNVDCLTGQDHKPPRRSGNSGNIQRNQPSSVRTNDSEPKSKPAGVKAMAAMFEVHNEPLRTATTQPKPANKALGAYMQSSPERSMRISTSGSNWALTSPNKTLLPQHVPGSGSKPLITATPAPASHQRLSETPKLRTSASDSVALRAAAIAPGEEQDGGPGRHRTPPTGLRPTQIQPAPIQPAQEDQKQNIMNLGSWVPHQEQPPVATHLNLARPASSTSTDQSRMHNILSEDSAQSIQRPRSTTSLHNQIRSLQRQLDLKVEEAAQLRRQLEAQEDADVRTLSGQLREAKRESQMWRDRAEAAERRVKVFERFTARLKGIRGAAASAEEQAQYIVQDDSEGSIASEEETSQNHQVRSVKGKVADRRTQSGDSGHTEDAGVVTARIRRCLHGSQAAHDGAEDGDLEAASGMDGSVSPREVRQFWMAAREFLVSEDAGR